MHAPLRRKLERFKDPNEERFRIENLLQILEVKSRKIVPLRFNEAQIKLYEKHRWFREHRMPVRIIICKARRAGLSTGVEALIFDDTWTNPNTYSLIIANEKQPSENVLKMCARFWWNMPEQVELENGDLLTIRPPLPPQFNNKPPTDHLQFAPPLDSHIFSATAKSVDAYLGYGFQNMHASEASRYHDAKDLMERSLLPTLSDDEHSALYIESTPNGQDGPGAWFCEEVMKAAERKRITYGEKALVFVPWHEMRVSFSLPIADDKRQAFEYSLNASERDILEKYPHVSLEQLAWYRMKLASVGGDQEIMDQEYPGDLSTSFMMSGHSVFGRKTIKRLIQRVREPRWEGDVYWGESDADNERIPIHLAIRRPHFLSEGEARDSGRRPHPNERTYKNLRVYRWPDTGERLFVTADVGGGNPESRDGDYSTICVGVLNELQRDELIMTWRGKLNPIAFAEVASALCWGLLRLVGDDVVAPELIPEWTGPGTGMCTYIDQKELYTRLYRYQVPGVTKMPRTKHIGWESNGKTTPMAMGYMMRMVDADLIDIPDELLVREMSTYRQTDSFGDEGSYGGPAGKHDDLVSSFRILCAILRLRSAMLPGDGNAPSSYVEAQWALQDESDELPAFDPFAMPEAAMPGQSIDAGEDDDYDESLFWSGV